MDFAVSADGDTVVSRHHAGDVVGNVFDEIVVFRRTSATEWVQSDDTFTERSASSFGDTVATRGVALSADGSVVAFGLPHDEDRSDVGRVQLIRIATGDKRVVVGAAPGALDQDIAL